MNRFVFSLCCIVMVSCSLFQNNEGNVDFEGISINSNIEEFSTQLKAKGFVDSGYQNCYLGKYLDEEAAVSIITNEESEEVQRVVVAINCPNYSLFDFKLKIGTILNAYTDKYGVRTEETNRDEAPGTLSLWGLYLYSWDMENQYVLINAVHNHPEKGNMIELHLSNKPKSIEK